VSLISHVEAAIEVAGRHGVGLVPELRARIGRWARRPPAPPRPVSLGELERRLADLGAARGRDLLIHSSWDGLRQVHGKPSDILDLLRSFAGPEATLVMPSHPVEQRQDGLPVFDVERSPTRMGLLAEYLRRTPGTRRGAFPIAPVCALGPAAERYTRDFRQESGGTPYGRGSPWYTICERGGQVLVLGIAPVRALTLMHVAFDLLGDANPIPDFYYEATWLVVHGGAAERWTVRRPERALEKYLATYAFGRMMTRAGVVAERADDGLRLACVDAGRFLDWHLPIARDAGFPYWGFPRARR
jgi:aminoglycoside N3'-acetyltransferase